MGPHIVLLQVCLSKIQTVCRKNEALTAMGRVSLCAWRCFRPKENPTQPIWRVVTVFVLQFWILHRSVQMHRHVRHVCMFLVNGWTRSCWIKKWCLIQTRASTMSHGQSAALILKGLGHGQKRMRTTWKTWFGKRQLSRIFGKVFPVFSWIYLKLFEGVRL